MDNDGAFATDPWAWFADAFERAQKSEAFDASRAALATANASGHPHVRFVLVKVVDARGLCFFTNLESEKARDLSAQPHAALAFHWESTGDQVRFEGRVQRVTEAESDAYFATRPRGSQLSAWASAQSQPIANRAALRDKAAEVERRFAGQSVPRPVTWGGYRLVPARIEFWHNRDDRLHDRWSFAQQQDGWSLQRLQP